MKVLDVNILVGALRDDHVHHALSRAWLARTIGSGEQIALTPVVVSGFLRVVTHSKVFTVPTPRDEAIAQVEGLLRIELVSWAMPGPRHWKIFTELCDGADARGNLVADAAIATIAVEHGATLVTFDRDFARFPGLRWEVPAMEPSG